MGKAKYLSQEFFPQLADLLESSNCLLVIISQVRQNIDPMSFEKYARAGGKAMDFYCHSVLWLANINKIKKMGRAIGITVKAKTTKSKTPRPYREMYFDMKFDYGLDNTATNVDFLFDLRTDKGEVIKDAGGSWEGATELNLDNLKKFLADNNVEDLYRETVCAKLKKSEVMEWLENHETLKDSYNETFMNKMKREELIQYIEEHNLEEELKKRVEDKWEAIEASIRTNRQPKYRKALPESLG
jgi:RecA/RadA recombinase